MSRFYASIEGNRGIATRQGTPKSGIQGHVRGWKLGVRVTCVVNAQGEDMVQAVLTGGSSDPGMKKDLGTFTAEDIQK